MLFFGVFLNFSSVLPVPISNWTPSLFYLLQILITLLDCKYTPCQTVTGGIHMVSIPMDLLVLGQTK